MKIGELASKAGISVRMLRWYEEQGLVLPHRRSSGYREYDNGHLRLMLLMKRLQGAGLSVSTIIELLPCIIEQHMLITECPKVMNTLKETKKRIRHSIKKLKLSEASLESVIATVGTPISEPEIDIINKNKRAYMQKMAADSPSP